jgi:predicted ribosome quality control (RQC) complex YloA/Tae2 family protein
VAGSGEAAGFGDGFDARRHLLDAESCADEALEKLAEALDLLNTAEESAKEAAEESPREATELLAAVSTMKGELAALATAAYSMKDFTDSQLYLLDTLEEVGRDVGWPPDPPA